MRFYFLETEFKFGKFEGKSVRDILEIQISYLDWCAINLDHFYMTPAVIERIKAIKPEFSISQEGMQKLESKYTLWETTRKRPRAERNLNNTHTYENHNGSYAQDVEGWSDQDIDDVFDGDPDNYWNID